MEKHHLARLESRITEVHSDLKSLVEQQPVTELIRIVHQPGWTTIAEEAFFAGLVDSMHAQTKTLLAMKQVLITGAEKVALNPQPLPQKASVAGS